MVTLGCLCLCSRFVHVERVKKESKMRRSKRLKAKNIANQDGEEVPRDDDYNESEKSEDLDVKSLVQKTYQFMISKMAAPETDTNCGEERETNSVAVPEFISLRDELKKLAKE